MRTATTVEAIGEFLRAFRENLRTIVNFDTDFKKKRKVSILPPFEPGEHWLWDFLADYSVA